MWWFLHVPSIFANGDLKKKKKEILKLLKYPKKQKFSKAWSWREKAISVSSCASNHHVSKKEGISLGCVVYERCQRGRLSWTRFSLLWSAALVAIQTQINRGGTCELMLEEGGGGVSEAGWRLRSPGALKSEGPVRITHTSSSSSGRDSHAAAADSDSPHNSSDSFTQLFSQLCQICAKRSEASQLTAWLHESFMDFWKLGKLFAALYWSSSPL